MSLKTSTAWCRQGIAALLFSASVAFGGSMNYYVAVNGSDSNPGTIDKPFATLGAARDAVRANPARGKQPITVNLRAGTYYLPETFVLDARDSGTKSAPVSYTAYGNEKVIISGGSRLVLSWHHCKKLHTLPPATAHKVMQAATPPGMQIDQLFINNVRRPMARYPNYDPNIMPYHGFAADAFSPARAARWSNPVGGYIHAMHVAHWGGYHYRITGKSADNKVTYVGGWQNNRQMGMHPKERFVENIFEELDAPGEWFHNATSNILYYYPLPGEDITNATIETARLRHLVEFRGTRDNPIKNVKISGIIFRHAARTFMETKEPLLRSDWTIYRGGAVLFNASEDCAIINCEFDQVGGNAVFVNNYNRRVTIRGTHIHGSGASGICFVGSPDSVRNPLFEYGQRLNYKDIDLTPGPKSDNYPADCLVDDCLIHNISVVEKQAAGVEISMSSAITVRHCSIYDVGRAGINISEGTFGGHVIEYCDVFDTVRETGDHGSFNSWGRDRFWGLKGVPAGKLPELALLDCKVTTIRNSRWRCDHGWDVDLDDGSSNYEIYNNVFLHGGLKLREGFYRRVWNNIGVNCSLHAHVWYPDSHDELKNNIWMREYPNPIRMPKGKWGNENDYNLFTYEYARDKERSHGWDLHSIVGDPMFVDPAKGDYRVKEGSPALKLGFKNFPMDQFGVQRPSLKAIARTPVLPRPVYKPISAAELKKSVRASYWQGAQVRRLQGEEFSAFGVSKESGGIHLIKVPATSAAAAAGLRQGDLIQEVDHTPVKSLAELIHAMDNGNGKSQLIGFIRGQKMQSRHMDVYQITQIENSNDGSFSKIIPAKGGGNIPIVHVSTTPKTANESPATLHDGRLAANYGAVFPNGTPFGVYCVDLGRSREIHSVETWSFSKNNNRGAQKFTLFGSNSKYAPQIPDEHCIALGSVDTTGMNCGKYQATRIKMNDNRPLGKFRWLLWEVYPVADGNVAHTSFQEFEVH